MTHVLVVEDDEQILNLLLELLDEEGYAVTGAANGRAALQVLETSHPDLIITDIMMPEMDGIALCSHIHTDPSIAGIPIIVCSAGSNKPLLENCSYTAFLPKPFAISAVVDAVESVLTV